MDIADASSLNYYTPLSSLHHKIVYHETPSSGMFICGGDGLRACEKRFAVALVGTCAIDTILFSSGV
ncbi:unnamed protein product [Colias eurytheme]|nr:unnamed protein product [Colias eurytheme]